MLNCERGYTLLSLFGLNYFLRLNSRQDSIFHLFPHPNPIIVAGYPPTMSFIDKSCSTLRSSSTVLCSHLSRAKRSHITPFWSRPPSVSPHLLTAARGFFGPPKGALRPRNDGGGRALNLLVGGGIGK